MATATKVAHSKLDAVPINPGLEVLYPDPEDPAFSKISIKFEIVAVPGLGANPEWTWKKDKVHWLRDNNMLARKIPNARISGFSYQSQWFGRGSVNQQLDSVANQLLYALDRSRRSDSSTPIIFVCHCLGGIIVEKALLTARLRQNDFPTIFPWVAGCIFLGTPFRGTNTQSKAMVLAGMAETIGFGTQSSLLKLLEKDSDALRSLLDEFALLAKEAQIRLFCFFEQEKSDLVGLFVKGSMFKSQELIVDEASATIVTVEKLPLKSNHFNLNKYEGPKDGNFTFVSEEIRITTQKAEGILKSRQNALRQALVNDRTYHTMIDHLGKGFQDIDAAINGSYRGPKSAMPSSILSLESFQSWEKQEAGSILWVHGKAGTGQGAVASSAIEHLKTSHESRSIVTSFYCDQSDRFRRTLKGLLQLIVRQVIDRDQNLAVHLLSDMRKGKDTDKQQFEPESSIKITALWEALRSMAQDLSGRIIYIIIYGLEQLSADSLKTFLQFIREFVDEISTDYQVAPIKWLLLSRTGRPEIQKTLKIRASEVNLEDEKHLSQVSKDLRNHISASVDVIGLPASLGYFAKRYIHSRSDDNFLYANLIIQELKNAWKSKHSHHADIRKLLESFPYGLTDMFEHIRKRVLDPQAEGFEYIKEILRCRICAYVAPTLRELAIMAGLPEEVQRDINGLKSYVVRCGAFLTFGGGDWDLESSTVEWIDPSAQEHLQQYAKEDLGLDLEDMQHGIIALRSLEYILHTVDRHQGYNSGGNIQNDDDGNVEDDCETRIFKGAGTQWQQANEPSYDSALQAEGTDYFTHMLRYPIFYWLEHAKRAPCDVLDELDLNHSFWQRNSDARQIWWRILEDVHAMPNQTNVSVLHVAVILQFPAFVDYLLERGRAVEVHAEDSEGFQPLYYACRGGREEIVNALLGAGADINYVSDNEKPTALHAASDNGHIDLVRLLLERDADINATSSENGTALYAAAANHDNEIFKLLLEHDAQVNIPGGMGKKALNIAAFAGNEEAVHLLLQKGADVDPDDDYMYGSALGAAARRGHTSIVKELLLHKWSPTRSMKTYGSFLTAAATYNHSEIVHMLLEWEQRVPVIEQALQAAAQRGYEQVVAVILAKTTTLRHHRAFSLAAFYGRTEVLKLLFPRGVPQELLDEALFQATDNEHEDTVKLLLDFGADVDVEGPVYGTALAASAYDGTTKIMEALIARGADVNKRAGEYGTALQAAAYNGDARNVALLVEHGALLNTESIGFYGNELQAAVISGDEDTIRLLLKNGADVNAFGGHYSYPIVAAVAQGYSVATKILLDHNAHVNVRGGENNWPVISLAAFTLPTADLKIVIKNVADINATCDNGTTALINCASACDTEGVVFLLQNEANVHLSSRTLGTALHAAAAQGDEHTCTVLLRAGAKVDAIGGPWGTALQAAAWAEDLETVQVLLKAKADVSQRAQSSGKYGTALQAAAAVGSAVIVNELLKRHASVNIRPANGRHGSALAAAAAGGFYDVVEALLNKKADVNFEGGLHGHPILAAAQSGNDRVVQILLDHGANASAAGGLLGTVIAAAAYGNNLSIMKKLVDQGINLHATGGKYGTAIQIAAIRADIEIIEYLLDHVVELVNHQGGKYHTALIAASYFNRMDVVSKLLDAGADFRFHGGRYGSAITAAAIRGNKALLDKFLSMGPPDSLLDEALVEACAFRRSASVESLIKAGANVYTKHSSRGTAMDAMSTPEAVDENSDIEDEDMDDEDQRDEDENDNDEENEQWEGDNISVAAETEDGSVTNLQLEDEMSEEAKIQRLLGEARARCKRNPTVKRFRTVKHHNIPSRLQAQPHAIPPVPNISTASSPSKNDNYSALYAKHSQEPWSLPFRDDPIPDIPSNAAKQQTYPPPTNTNHMVYELPSSSLEPTQPLFESSQRTQSPENASQRHYSMPPPPHDRYSTTSPEPSTSQSSTPPPRQGSQDHGLRRSSKAVHRKPIVNTGISGRYQQQQRQASYPGSKGATGQNMDQKDFVAIQTGPPENLHKLTSANTNDRQFRQHSEPQKSMHRMSLSAVQQEAPQLPSQHPAPANYLGWSPPSLYSPPASAESSQVTDAAMFGSKPYLPWDAPTTMQGAIESQDPIRDKRTSKWGGGGYDGEGYG